MNAIALHRPNQPPDRTARHVRMCAELAGLGMQLARRVAAKTAPGTIADPSPLFVDLSHTVRECLVLEASLAEGSLTSGATGVAAAVRGDPRRASLRDAFRLVTENHPDRAELRRETAGRLDQALADDPARARELPDILFGICDELGIAIDLTRLPDEYLGMPTPN